MKCADATGGRTPRHFASIEDLMEWVARDLVSAQLREVLPLHARYEYLWTADGTLMPSPCSPFVSPFLYRGQVVRHKPCIASVFRGLSIAGDCAPGWRQLTAQDRARLFVDRVRLEEFALALRDHPASEYATTIGLRLSSYGLAQHYEMATDRLDLTLDHAVAAFFATNRLVSEQWVPVSEGQGVIYRIRTTALDQLRPNRLECLGKQSLPRPGEQRAFTLTLPLMADFENLPVELLTFDQDGACSRRLNDRFTGVASLFPPDVMADVARSIRAEKSISRDVAECVLSQDNPSRQYLGHPFSAWEALIEADGGMPVSGRGRITLTPSQRSQAISSVERMRETFLDNVGAIAVRRA